MHQRKLWGDEHRIDRAELPSYAQMLKDQGVTSQSVEELQASIDESYSTRLYSADGGWRRNSLFNFRWRGIGAGRSVSS